MCSFNKPFGRRGSSKGGRGISDGFLPSSQPLELTRQCRRSCMVVGTEQWLSHEGGVRGYLCPQQDSRQEWRLLIR